MTDESPVFSTRSRFEIGAVLATGILHLVFFEILNAKALFISLALSGWIAYCVIRLAKDRRVIKTWGFGADNLGGSFIASSIVAAIAIAALSVIAKGRGSLSIHWHMLPLILLYPIWGLAQQFLIQALVVGNLNRFSNIIGSSPALTIIAAILFGMVHVPDGTLVTATFLLGLAFTPIYLRWRNLWPLGIYHGILGVFFYFWGLHRDPWLEVFAHR
jgi:Type II CAAX prenyl endopeptidase Rce1-like